MALPQEKKEIPIPVDFKAGYHLSRIIKHLRKVLWKATVAYLPVLRCSIPEVVEYSFSVPPLYED